MIKKIGKIILIIVLFIALSGAAGVFMDRSVMPWLASKESLKRFRFFQKMNERVTVINRTEQVTVKEDYSVTKTAQNILPSVVSIITYDEKNESSPSVINIRASQDIQNLIKTGLIITSDGLVMSVLDTEEVKVDELNQKKYKILAVDGREFDAKVIAVDPYANLIFYKADANNLAAPVFGNSDELESGEKIIIAGNATGEYQNTFSLGIIKEKDKTFSVLNSELSSSEKREGAILTDALIERTNVGGPVIDFNGTVVGIAYQIEKDGKKVGFVIPINDVKESIDTVIKNAQLVRPSLGLYYLSINREIALLNNLPVDQGALVYSFSGQQGLAVIKNSAADLAGVKIGDIITEVNGEKVTLDQPLSKLISKQKTESEITLKVLRMGKDLAVKVKL